MKERALRYLLVAFLGSSLVLGSLNFYFYHKSQEAKSKVTSIQSKLQDKNARIENLQSELDKKQQTIESFQSKLDKKEQTIVNLRTTLESKKNEIERLEDKLKISVSPPYVVVENRTFTISYRDLEGEIVTWWWTAGYLEDQIWKGNTMNAWELSTLEWMGWENLTKRFEGETKYRNLEEFGVDYEYDAFTETNGLNSLAENIYGKYETDEKRIRAVWNLVSQLETYHPDYNESENIRMPLETLLMEGGDCEDTSIFTASILEAMPSDWEVKMFSMDSEHPTDPETLNHMIVYVDTGNYSTFIETTNNETMNPYDEGVSGFSEEVEPWET